MWLEHRTTDSSDGAGRPQQRSRKRRVLHQRRCSTFADLGAGEFAVMVAVLFVVGLFVLLAGSLIGQEFLRYLARLVHLQRG